MKPVALDAMGGDRAPEAAVAGAVSAARELSIPVVLVGEETRLTAELARYARVPDGIEVVHAGDVIGMEESPGQALLRKRDSSVMVAVNLVKEGRASGVVSAGNSGAVTGAALLRLGMLPGVDRPAIASLFPTRRGKAVVLDVGATVDATPEQLVAFARIGERYARCMLHMERPRVGLLSIGEEPSKGNAVIKKTFPLLEASGLSFVGNVEGGDVAQGSVEVVVCDGFTGNVLLKVVEGYVEFVWEVLKEALRSSWRSRLGAWLAKPALLGMASRFDYAAYGGALLLGVNGVVVIGHGRSNATAVTSALRVAKELAEQRVVEELVASFGRETQVGQVAWGAGGGARPARPGSEPRG